MAEQLVFPFIKNKLPSGFYHTYALAGGPPENWNRIGVYDKETGSRIENVIEADTLTGRIRRYVYDDKKGFTYRNGNLLEETIYKNNFVIIEVDEKYLE